MTRWLPRTLFGQMVVILLAGLVVSHLIGTLIFASDRAQAVRAIGGFAATQRIANLARLVDDAPPAWRSRIVAAASDPTLLVTLAPQPPAFAQTGAEPTGAESTDAEPTGAVSTGAESTGAKSTGAKSTGAKATGARSTGARSTGATPDANPGPIQRYLAEQLPAPLAEHLHVVVSAAAPPIPTHAGAPLGSLYAHHMAMGGMPMSTSPWMGGFAGGRGLQAAMQISDGEWLSFVARLPDAGTPASWPFVAAMAMMAVVVVLASVWAVGRVTAPVGIITRAAERLGRDVNAPPIAEAGTSEMRRAAQSFNQMQQRIQLLLDNRTRMLAALSHDLRTPLTLLRLRTENLQEAEERDRMLATIGELSAMIDASLSFARDQATTEAFRQTDLTALVASVVDDMADAGLKVAMAPADPVVLACQPAALRRALRNLIDNAVKYGETAHVTIMVSAATVRIDIDDSGPGIPDAELQRVFEPFHRLEPSRSRETGGTGLGLSIALSIAQAHGGEVTLANLPKGGLRARLSLPC
jgi:signal transduction histidine kinase